jgi:hypothetical protein
MRSASSAPRTAPHFQPNGDVEVTSPSNQYTPETLAKFLGWNKSKVKRYWTVLAASEEGVIEEAETVGLTTYQAEAAARQGKSQVHILAAEVILPSYRQF